MPRAWKVRVGPYLYDIVVGNPPVVLVAFALVSGGVEAHAKNSWNKGLDRDIPQEVVLVEQYNPHKDLINEFESRRNELDRSLGGRKLQTIQAFVTLHNSILRKVLKQGFYRALGVQKLAFSTDPSLAIREGGGGNQNKILLCRITLGREGTDYQFTNNKYIIENLQGIMPAFLITYAAPNEAISLSPLSAEPEFQPVHGEEEIVFHEAVVRRYEDDGQGSLSAGIEDHSKNVFGEEAHALKSEEDRILRHFKKG